MKIGLTGGIASGKSTVSNILRKLGAEIIDADKITHRLMEPKKELWQKIVVEFGDDILLEAGQIDRERLGDIVFSDSTKRRRLEEISHPIIIKELRRRMELSSNKIVIADIPLLIETGMVDLFDQVWLVYVEESIQIERLMRRDEINYQSAIKKIKSQMPLIEKRDYADKIIENNRGEEELKDNVVKLWGKTRGGLK